MSNTPVQEVSTRDVLDNIITQRLDKAVESSAAMNKVNDEFYSLFDELRETNKHLAYEIESVANKREITCEKEIYLAGFTDAIRVMRAFTKDDPSNLYSIAMKILEADE